MPTETIVVLSFIISAFILFGVVLAYGEYQTRHLKREADAAAPAKEHEQEWRKAA